MAKRILYLIIKLAISVFFIGFLLNRIGLDKIAETVKSVDIKWMIFAFIIFTASHFLGSYQWSLLLSSEGIKIKWLRVLSFYFVGLFFNNFLPSNLGGDLFRMFDVHKFSKKGTSAVSTVFIDRFMGLLVLSGMAVLVLPWILIKGIVKHQYIIYLIILILGWVFILFLLFNKSFARAFARIFEKFVSKLSLRSKVKDVYLKVHNFGKCGSFFMRILFLSIIIQSARIIMHYLVARSLGVNIAVSFFFLIIPFIAIIASLPVSFGGIGVRESAGMFLFGIIGLAEGFAVTIEFLAYVIAVVSSIPGGILFISRRNFKNNDKI